MKKNVFTVFIDPIVTIDVLNTHNDTLSTNKFEFDIFKGLKITFITYE